LTYYILAEPVQCNTNFSQSFKWFSHWYYSSALWSVLRHW
jgi:hypothetical protein